MGQPCAISYTLESDIHNMQIYGQKYSNACFENPGGKANDDILYGDNQNIDNFGSAASMSSFIPKYLANGCHSPANNVMIPIKIDKVSIKVTPIVGEVDKVSSVIGFSQSSEININCNQICNDMLKQSCLIESDYCAEFISAAYQRSSVYLLRKIPEYFCACQITNSAQKYSFTQAVDIESAINYNNPLSNVVCSNFPTGTGQ